jgi:pentatricopeptide repeat protein
MISKRERREILGALEKRLTFYQAPVDGAAGSIADVKEAARASAGVRATSLTLGNAQDLPATIDDRPVARRRGAGRKRMLGLIQNLMPAPVEEPPTQRSIAPVDEVSANTESSLEVTPVVQTGLVSRSEFLALFDDCIQSQDLSTARQVLDSMRDHGLAVPASEITLLLDAYAKKGDSTGVAELLQKEEQLHRSPSRTQLATLVQAHLSAGKKHQAVHLLHDFEARQLTLPQSAYRSVIDTLLTPSPTMKQADKALAWDLFAHMRLVAHPVPSVELYNTMIRACADPKDPQPEVALDMFTQMVQENQQSPTADTYNMMIRALAKVKKYYYESFRLLRQMLEIHQTALQAGLAVGQMETGYEPTVVTFNALLEGTKRVGDLGRARWILAEMAKIGAFVGDGGHDKMLSNEETMVNVFHTYAAFTPLVGRADVKVATPKASAPPDASLQSDSNSSSEQRSPAAHSSSAVSDEPIDSQETHDQVPRPMSLLDIGSPDFVPPYQPQTAYEAFTEATQLFDLVLYNIASQQGAFRQVAPTPRLINAYLSVALAHAPLDKALHMQMGIWHDERIVSLHQNLRPNGWTYLFALERCAAAKNKPEKHFLAEDDVLERIWQGYERWNTEEIAVANRLNNERTSRASETSLAQEEADRYKLNVGLGPREVERCWVAVIAAFALYVSSSFVNPHSFSHLD